MIFLDWLRSLRRRQHNSNNAETARNLDSSHPNEVLSRRTNSAIELNDEASASSSMVTRAPEWFSRRSITKVTSNQFDAEPFKVNNTTLQKAKEPFADGAFGDLYFAADPSSNEVVAIKIILGNKRQSQEALEEELRIHQDLNHPNIIKLLYAESSPISVTLVMELASIDVFDYTKAFGGLSELECLKVLRDILAAILYLHQRLILHKDIKPENILIMHDGTCKLTDFGYSKRLKTASSVDNTFVGTPTYAAPELLLGYYAGLPVDIWSLGVTIHNSATDFSLFPHEIFDIHQRMVSRKLNFATGFSTTHPVT